MTKLPAFLRSRRELLGMSLEDVAQAVGSSKSYMYEIERGKSEPGFLMAIRLSVALQTSISLMASAALAQEKEQSA